MTATQKSRLGKNIKAHLCPSLGYLKSYPAVMCSTCKENGTSTMYLNEEQFEAMNEHYMKLKRDKLR